MSTKYKNKPIHPTPAASGCSPTFGMTLREHYAGLALQGIMSAPNYNGNFSATAKDAVKIAGAVIEELERTK